MLFSNLSVCSWKRTPVELTASELRSRRGRLAGTGMLRGIRTCKPEVGSRQGVAVGAGESRRAGDYDQSLIATKKGFAFDFGFAHKKANAYPRIYI